MSSFGMIAPLGAFLGSTQAAFGPPAQGNFGGLRTGADLLAISGLITGAIGSFYAVQSQQSQLRSQALSLEFQQSMANINARAAELQAREILEAGRKQKALVTLRHGQIAGRQRATQAAAGVQAGVGSAAEVRASTELAKEIDALTIDANAARAAAAARRRAVNFGNVSLLSGVSAQNVRGTAGSLSPLLTGGSSLLGGASLFADRFLRRRELQALAGRFG